MYRTNSMKFMQLNESFLYNLPLVVVLFSSLFFLFFFLGGGGGGVGGNGV